MKALLASAALLALAGCSTQLQGFTAADLANASALATAGGDTASVACWTGLGMAAAPTPAPASDGLATLAERKRLAMSAIYGPCAPVLAPALLMALGKAVPAPFNLLLPF